ncbi:hypothetical protein IEQ34_009394 [Dendrobium chrysotoxum]|uniref:Uncharacterized protein n=1 Tax=Dendrobium chrysotoxum TaxID=161865 RepID=A0AAV7GJ47_DENCH|nr:hypothetical protein IEQ34_009394 [Dendrobium chrysotoxum]
MAEDGVDGGDRSAEVMCIEGHGDVDEVGITVACGAGGAGVGVAEFGSFRVGEEGGGGENLSESDGH